jgi:hypothetical protein
VFDKGVVEFLHARSMARCRICAQLRTPGLRMKEKRKRYRHNVYVIELDPAVYDIARFRRANPDHDITKPCVYVGCTGLTPEARFAKHKAGIRASRYVQRFGLRLLPRLYAYANPMPYGAARDMEVELAIALRAEGYAVWQG